MLLRFTKMHGLGNDFVVLDGVTQELAVTPEMARHLGDRHFGIGCDQLLVVEPPARPDVDFRYRIFNADGSEVAQCGNGARCLAKFVRDQKLSTKDRIRVQTGAGILELIVKGGNQYQVDMGVPRLEPAEIPLAAPARSATYRLAVDGRELEFRALSIGNPHAVLVVPEVKGAPVAELGARIGADPLFPEGVNVGFMAVLDRHRIDLRVYERGAGETLACGSGACAAAVAGILGDLLDSPVRVHLPGGALTVDWAGEGQPVFMTGPAVTVFQGRIRYEPQKFRQSLPHG
ncbi:MAG: diaminopimelate epimerase [Pseudomonadota bacterium]